VDERARPIRISPGVAKSGEGRTFPLTAALQTIITRRKKAKREARVPRQVAMRLVGHRTESIYRRYAIVSESDTHEAGASLDTLASTTKSGQSRNSAAGGDADYQEILIKWCRGRGSNPHVPCGTQDFKSCASASFATPARGNSLEFTRSAAASCCDCRRELRGASQLR
jgi:hypothetical protein